MKIRLKGTGDFLNAYNSVCFLFHGFEGENSTYIWLQTQPVTQKSWADFQSVVFVTNTLGNGQCKT